MRLYIFDQDDVCQAFADNVVPKVFRDLFAFLEPVFTKGRFVGNTDSRVFHLANSNHGPPASSRSYFASESEALDAGFSKCAICFSEAYLLPVTGYSELRMDALEKARLYEVAFPPVDDLPVQQRFAAAGHSVLDNFPFELTGYNYKFSVLQSELPNAVSFPTGFVYITAPLMSSVEHEAELDFILAHEIAHIEFYQPITEPSGAASLEDVEEFYERKQDTEIESDLVGLIYLTDKYGESDGLSRAANALKKMQFANESVPPLEANAYITHPNYPDRLALFDTKTLSLFPGRPTFCAFGEDGSLQAEVTLLAKKKEDRATRLYFLVHVNDIANEPTRVGARGVRLEGTITLSDGTQLNHQSRNSPYISIEPGEKAIVYTDVNIAFQDLTADGVKGLTFKGVKDVTAWHFCPKE